MRARGADPEPLQFALAVHAARERLCSRTRRADESAAARSAVGVLPGRGGRHRRAPGEVAEVERLPFVRRISAGRSLLAAPTAR